MKENIKSALIALGLIFMLVMMCYQLIIINEVRDDIDERRAIIYDQMNDSFHNSILGIYGDTIYHLKEMELITGENRTEDIDYWQDKIDNYEYIEFYRPAPRVPLWATILGQLIVIVPISIMTFYVGKSIGNSGGNNNKTNEEND